MKEPIEVALKITGIKLIINNDSYVLAIPGFELNNIITDDNKAYSVEVTRYSFKLASCDVITENIIKDLIFTFTDDVYIYTFKVYENPIPDLTGWSTMEGIFLSKIISEVIL